MIVWIVELRERHPSLLDATVMHVASSRENAEAWIKRHPDANVNSPYDWHWWIGADKVDNEDMLWDHDYKIYSPDGTVMEGL